jgi:xylose isomerase
MLSVRGRDPLVFFSPRVVLLKSHQLAKRRIDVAFEFYRKLRVEYYTFHDFDVAPQGATLEESFRNIDIITDYLLQKQKETGIKLLW